MERESKSVSKAILDMSTSVFQSFIIIFAMVQVTVAVITLGWNIIEGLIVRIF